MHPNRQGHCPSNLCAEGLIHSFSARTPACAETQDFTSRPPFLATWRLHPRPGFNHLVLKTDPPRSASAAIEHPFILPTMVASYAGSSCWGQSAMQLSDCGLRYGGSVCISGLTAAGKSTHSHLLAGEYG